jgi:hypothetical protein
MPRPTKRSLALQQAGRKSVKAKKLKRTLEENKEEGEIPEGASSDGALSTGGSESRGSSSDSEEIEMSEPEGDFVGQPRSGWRAAERQLPGYPKHSVGSSKHSRYHTKKKVAQQQERQGLQSTYGDISRFFVRHSVW